MQRIDAIHPLVAGQFWKVIEPLIEKMCARAKGEFTPDGVHDRVVGGEWVLWLATDEDDEIPLPQGVAATQIEQWDDGSKVCRILFVSADRIEDWKAALKKFETYAQSEGCKSIRTEGRPGWMRRMNWKPVSYTYEVEI